MMFFRGAAKAGAVAKQRTKKAAIATVRCKGRFLWIIYGFPRLLFLTRCFMLPPSFSNDSGISIGVSSGMRSHPAQYLTEHP